MTIYPNGIDNDSSIIRVDDNLSEIGGQAINQARSAIFAIEKELGTSPSGTLGSVADRLNVALNPNGTIKASALTSIGLATLPIHNNHVASNAGILESKLSLDFSTSDLNAALQSNITLVNSLNSFTSTTNSNLLTHISGGSLLADGSTPGRHVASHIDLNSVPSDARDPSFNWTGLLDKDGNERAAETVAEALLEINDEFTSHQNNEEGGAHFASGIGVDTADFNSIPKNSNTVQKAIQSIDDANTLIIGTHQGNLHSNGIPRKARTELLQTDGYSDNIIPPTSATAFLVAPPAGGPVDSNSSGDDIISFNPDNTGFVFDNLFSKVAVGDILRINYGNGIESIFTVESKRHLPGVEWVVRINGKNIFNTGVGEAFVRIDRPLFVKNNYGVLAAAAANNNIDPSIMGSIIIGNPRGANALGLGFDASQLDSSHYNLYLNLYPTGNPQESTIALPAIDVTGNQGTTPGKYTLESVVQAANDKFRSGGYNYRFIAYAHDGNFGVMLADDINNASFSIVNGGISGASLVAGSFSNNVVGDATDGKDALGFGKNKSAIASPNFTSSFVSANAGASFATIVLSPARNKHYVVNGNSKDLFSKTYLANQDGYWDGYISNRVPVGASTVEITYQIEMDLSPAGLMPGKTIVIQPAISTDSPEYSSVDYGRFIIKGVQFKEPCDTDPFITSITVINGRHATGTPIGTTAFPPLPVRLYFSNDSVGFNAYNVIDASSPMTDFVRYHEVFADKDGKTFSHERARLTKQNESAELLRTTTNWKIKEVSPKFRGYKDTSSSDFNKYIRFYVLNYDEDTGEFDGYLGQRVFGTANIEKTGRIVRARKNVPSRFYDVSNIDFIELEYTDTNPSPGLNVLTTNAPRYVDIEIFPSLAQNQECIRLAGCVIDENRVESVLDLREFGNVGTDDLSTSAIQFIESGDRELHENGIISGLDFIVEDPGVAGLLHFKGGKALVNGHISVINDQSISIPEVVAVDPLRDTLNWAVCVNDHDALEVILLSDTKEQIFVKRLSDASNYYIPSVTFAELVNDRKDLVPTYIVNVTIASITVNDISDVRRFIKSETASIPLTLFGRNGLNNLRGHFNNFEQVKNWVNSFGQTSNNYVKLSGTIVINDEVDLSDLSSPIVLDGDDGGTIIVNSAVGLRVGTNFKIKNTSLLYNAEVGGLSESSNLHVNVDAGCILIDSMSDNISNVEVSKCNFLRSISSKRPPFIHARVGVDKILSNCTIEDNEFYSNNDNVINAAIAIVGALSGDEDIPPAVTNLKIKENYLDNKQCIAVIANDGGIDPVPSGIYVNHGLICGNKLDNGAIGYNIMSSSSSAFSDSFRNGLTIRDNEARRIGFLNSDGKVQISTLTIDGFGTGNVKILNNTCSKIHCAVFADNETHQRASLSIKGNTLRENNVADEFADYGTGVVVGIYVNGQALGSSDEAHPAVQITENDIDRSENYEYLNAIQVWCPSVISNNIIRGFTGYGIFGGIPSLNTPSTLSITGNHIYRGSNSIPAYILTTSSNTASHQVITDNVFDSHTIDGTSTDVISYNSSEAAGSKIIERNVNQTVNFYVKHTLGNVGMVWTVGSSAGLIAFRGSGTSVVDSSHLDKIVTTSHRTNIDFASGAAASTGAFNWIIPLNTILPPNVKIVNLSCTFSMQTGLTDVGGTLSLVSYNGTTTGSIASTTVNPSVSGVGVTATISDVISTYAHTNLHIIINMAGTNGTASATSMEFRNLQITYRY